MLTGLLREYLRPFRRFLAIVVVLQFVQTLASLYLPRLNADIIDRGVVTGNKHEILVTGSKMLGLSAVQIVASIGAVYFGSRVAAGFGRNLRARVFCQVVSFSTQEVTTLGAPTLITRCTNDVQQVQLLSLMGANMLISTPITVIGGIVMALREDTRLSWLLVVCIPAMVGSLGLLVSRMIPRYRAMQIRIDAINGILREQLSGMRVVRAFVREPFETERFRKANTDVTDVALAVGRLIAFMFPIVTFIFNVSSVAVLWFGANRIEHSGMQVGSLIAFLTYLMQILVSVMMATFVATMVPRAAASAERINEVLTTSSSVVPPATPVTEMPTHASVSIENVSFKYPSADRPVICDISLTARPGMTTAIIGATGAGKTTLLNLIPRLIDPTSGTVKVNGVDVRELDPKLLASSIALVPQAPYLFSGTVASNMRYGKPDATDDELWDALRIAQIEDFVRSQPDALEMPISQGGTNVSGGQRQRLAIARALVHKPQIYLFDDAFSALDMTTDAKLRLALRSTVKDAAMIVVAQRVSSIRDADHILVIEAGAIVGEGTHDELKRTCEQYREIVESQLAAEDAA